MAFRLRDAGDEGGDAVMDGLNGAGLGHPHPVFDLCEHLLDGVEVGRVGRQECQSCAGAADRGAEQQQ